MMDRENVIEQLEYAWKYIQERPNPTGTPKAMAMNGIKKAIALLKEQEAVVRCADCRHADISPSGLIKCRGIFRSREWYCADGEKADT